MKKIIILLTLTLALTGCFSYRDVNRVVFVMSVGIDVDEHDNPVLYVEAFHGFRAPQASEGQESRLIFTGSGKTVFEAIRHINRSSAFKLNYTQNKAVIFSEKAAELGLDKFLDVLFRDQELLTRQFIYVSKVDIEELMDIKMQEEEFLGIFLFDLAENMPILTKRPYMRIDDFYINRKLGSKINVLFTISKLGNPFIDRIDLSTLVIMNEDKMISELNHDETFIYSIIDDNLQSGYITIPNPQVPDMLITLEILKSNTKTSVKYNDSGNIDITKEVNMRATIAEVQGTFTLSSSKERHILQENAEKKIKMDSMALYEKYREDDIDIYNLKRDIDIKYPNANIDEDTLFDSINFNVNVSVFIEGSTDVVDFY